MQKNEFDNIDSKLKAMLENASVTPSKGVWKGIESRLAPVPAKSGRGAWIWALGLAGAAAVLALALVVSQPVQEASFKASDAVATVEDVPVQGIALQIPSKDESEYAAAMSREIVGHKVPSVKEFDSAPVATEPVVIENEESPVAPAAEKEEQTAPLAEERQVATAPANEPVQQYDSGIFERMEREDLLSGSKTGGIRATASGAIGQNIGVSHISKNPMRAGGIFESEELKSGIYESGASVYGVPISFGIGLNIPLGGIFSIDTGIDYSLLTRSFEGVYTEIDALGANTVEGNVLHHMHYIGIPVNLNLNLFQNRKINVYSLVGGEIEYCISNIYTIRGPQSEIRFRDPVKAPQFSIKLGVGIEAKLTRHLGLFLEPSARYYFQNSQPKSIRTEKQLLIGGNLGLKFDL